LESTIEIAKQLTDATSTGRCSWVAAQHIDDE
jgi:hypothetical protein